MNRVGWISILSGGGLALYGLRKRRLVQTVSLGLIGLALVYRGISRPGLTCRSSGGGPDDHPAAVTTIQRPREEVYRFSRDLTNAPRYMSFVEDVRAEDAGRSHWTAVIRGRRVEWDAEVCDEKESEFFRWRSRENAPIRMEGEFRFESAPSGRGTVVRSRLNFSGRSVLDRTAGFLARYKFREDLRRLKQLMEAGEIVTVQGQSSGRKRAGAQELRRGVPPERGIRPAVVPPVVPVDEFSS